MVASSSSSLKKDIPASSTGSTDADGIRPAATPSSATTSSTGTSASKSNGIQVVPNDTKRHTAFHYEFGGPIGTLINIIVLPIIVVALSHWSRVGYITFHFDNNFYNNSNADTTTNGFFPSLILLFQSSVENIVTCLCIVLGWLFYQVVLERCVPANVIYGTPIQIPVEQCTSSTTTSKVTTPLSYRLQYRINGHLIFLMTLFLFVVGWPYRIHSITTNNTISIQFGTCPYWSYLYHHFTELSIATSILCYIGAAYLYIHSFRHSTDTILLSKSSSSSSIADETVSIPVILASGGNSGNVFYDYFMGRELNPRPSSSSRLLHSIFQNTFDYKEFCELRPGLIGWMILNVSCIYEQHKVLGYNTGSMILINIFQGLYVWDALYNEAAILSTMDITTDGFGFMLLFGDLCWVPFTYSIQARYLVHHDPHLSMMQLLGVIVVHIIGYTIFRSANGQKDTFRRNPDDPSVSHLTYLSTKRGTKLLTSGWWGMARKINYTGDYIMGLSWCMVCGFDSIVPYFYAIYFLILLIHRSERDDHMCSQKYGADWLEYKRIVPYRFIPGIV